MSSPVRTIITLGLDVHKESITVAVLPGGAPAPTRLDRLPNDLTKVHRYFDRLELPAPDDDDPGTNLHRAPTALLL